MHGNVLEDLTPRELEILALVADGHSNTAIARRLWLSTRTVEAHVRSVFLKLGLTRSDEVERRVVAALAYWRRSTGILPAQGGPA